jgi:teichuronic acid biosynthesis glycosyltransferase TuaC
MLVTVPAPVTAPDAPVEEVPSIVVFSPLFPSSAQPIAGTFVRERMFRLRHHARLIVVAPQPWFPFQSLLTRIWPHYRPAHPVREVQQGIDVLFPRFLSVPGLLRSLDGFSMAVCVLPLMRRLVRTRDLDVIDAHFAYPAGYAAALLGKWLGLPVSITLRGTESVHLRKPRLAKRVVAAVEQATKVFSVSDALRRLLIDHGIAPGRIEVIGNGVDVSRFRPLDRAEARDRLGLSQSTKVLVSVGGLVERKGFHRVIDVLPALLQAYPDLCYLVIGAAGPAGDMSAQLRSQVARLVLHTHVRFMGVIEPDRLPALLCAADVFVLATRYEGWANVFLEAMACGLPVVTTRVGGNAEVVASPEVGTLVPFDDAAALCDALADAMTRTWDRKRIVEYARQNSWDRRVDTLRRRFVEMKKTARATGR